MFVNSIIKMPKKKTPRDFLVEQRQPTFEWFTSEDVRKAPRNPQSRVNNDEKSTGDETARWWETCERERNHEISQTPHTRVLENSILEKKIYTHFHAFIEKNFQGGLRRGKESWWLLGSFELQKLKSARKVKWESFIKSSSQSSPASFKVRPRTLRTLPGSCSQSIKSLCNTRRFPLFPLLVSFRSLSSSRQVKLASCLHRKGCVINTGKVKCRKFVNSFFLHPCSNWDCLGKSVGTLTKAKSSVERKTILVVLWKSITSVLIFVDDEE
jgi:hypothetical protein